MKQVPEQESTTEAADEEAIARLQECIGELPPIYREVMILCGLQRRKYEEAAEVLQIPVGTVRSRLNKARLLLKDSFFKA